MHACVSKPSWLLQSLVLTPSLSFYQSKGWNVCTPKAPYLPASLLISTCFPLPHCSMAWTCFCGLASLHDVIPLPPSLSLSLYGKMCKSICMFCKLLHLHYIWINQWEKRRDWLHHHKSVCSKVDYYVVVILSILLYLFVLQVDLVRNWPMRKEINYFIITSSYY